MSIIFQNFQTPMSTGLHPLNMSACPWKWQNQNMWHNFAAAWKIFPLQMLN